MRISPINNSYKQINAYKQAKKINFGKFADENARKKVREITEYDEYIKEPGHNKDNHFFTRFEKDENFIIYTDKNGDIRVRMSDSFLEKIPTMKPGSQTYLKNVNARLNGTGIKQEKFNDFYALDYLYDIMDDADMALDGLDTAEEYLKKQEEFHRREAIADQDRYVRDISSDWYIWTHYAQ